MVYLTLEQISSLLELISVGRTLAYCNKPCQVSTNAMLGQTDRPYARMSGHFTNLLGKWPMAGSKIVHWELDKETLWFPSQI